ncbi:hypothetical protein [Leptospira sp. 'Mane']|uniref:hypothetical protein n=1 Tax=Leptospira sp. 'Mane' TaxID=3387407 RepID=UPI00398B8900
MKKLITYSLVILGSMIANACGSPGDRVRSLTNTICQNVGLPNSAVLNDGDIIKVREKNYAYLERYISLMGHASHLAECAKSLTCSNQWTEWERDCQAGENKILRVLLGIKTKCEIPKPDC